ncbi:ribbon-helix-helix domain-containing protein [Azospirillum thermophilum]|uniref:ribbon-helix-helix domain-containing protein n=1 Tax=Azospirillum thermophilum TaxID=2202148 RepID=UPI00143DFEA5|nr:ribbon-helix-helix domain-containing protein [Azospirillum thermophilum]
MEFRNVRVNGRRTSMRLETQIWDALEDIARREGTDLNGLLTHLDMRRGKSSLASAARLYTLAYYRAAAEQSFPTDFERPAPIFRPQGAGHPHPHPHVHAA